MFVYFIFHLIRQTQSITAQSSVYLMLVGAVIAASDDLAFNWFGYVVILMNNLCTAAQGIVIKQKLVNKVNKNSGKSKRLRAYYSIHKITYVYSTYF